MATTVYKKSAMLTDKPMHYCPGCAHGLVHKLVAEATEELLSLIHISEPTRH